ncbi:MAG: aspartate/glutamate racemase family protein [Janthinobacterium lividum]
MKTVGVLGGMGPAATLDFLATLHHATRAGRDQDHLRVITDSNPQVPDRNAALRGEGPSPGPVLAAMARGLAAAGADLLVMPCNAAHAWTDEIRAATSLPFISMIDAAAAEVDAAGASRIGLLAVDATLSSGLYQHRLARGDVTVLAPDRAEFMALIYRVKGGDTGPAVRAGMAALVAALVADDADLILVACTEVPLVLDPRDSPVAVVSSTGALVAATIAAAGSP